MIAIGMLDRRVVLEWPTVVQGDQFGGTEAVEWAFTTRWAHVIEKGAVELQEADQFVGASTVEFYVHYLRVVDSESYPAPDDTWRIKWDDNSEERTYEVKSVDEINGRLHRYHKFITVLKTNEPNNT